MTNSPCITSSYSVQDARTVRLTDAGHAYLDYANRALRELAAGERAVHDVTDLSRGHLRLAVTPTFTAYLVGPLTAELHRRHPGITLTVREASQERIESELASDTVVLGIAFDAPSQPGIAASTLFTETLRVVTNSAAPLATEAAQTISAHALENHPLALLTRDFATRRHIDNYCSAHHISPRIAVEANSVQALTEIVRQAPMATVLPDAITHDHPELIPIDLDPPIPTRTAVLLTREGGYRSAACRAFIPLAHDLTHALPAL
ncbi:transcriptional regulator CynR [Nocardia nepalensis]|uniref:transcriptional regulator CynR n=1 Tax=Nocardia nepalensis TaxID=3375448 RepID=UPI003B67BD7B